MSKRLPYLIFLAFFSFAAHAQIATPKYANEFLSIGVGARAISMGNSVVESVDDASAGYWNPAGLLNIRDKHALTLMHTPYFGGISNYDYLGFSTSIDKRSQIGFSLIRFAVDDIPDTRYLFDADGRINYDNVASFSAADYAGIISYARRFPQLKDIRFGANAKIIYRNVGRFAQAWGIGFDAGLQWNDDRWNVGATLRDVTGTFNSWSYNPQTFYDVFSQTDNTIPDYRMEVALPRLMLGVGRHFPLYTRALANAEVERLVSLYISVGMDMTFDGKRNTLLRSRWGSIDPRLGMELSFWKMVFVRAGLSNVQQVKDFDGALSYELQPNFGLGFVYEQLGVDYGLTDLGNQSSAVYSHIISLRYHFGVSRAKEPRYRSLRAEDLYY